MGLFTRKAAPVDTFVFPPSPEIVPEGLTKPTPKYRRQAVIAMLSLGAFVLLYVGLIAWFAWTAYVIFANIHTFDKAEFYVAIAGACSAFLALFLAKNLFSFQRGSTDGLIELKRKEQPRLFNFIHAIAKETGAPKPHRVFLSPRVNAAVFYDLSFLTLFMPSRKNLEIGLGLVNTLSISEFKAVLAHEFGHFAQKSMAVGRWVYIAQQVATQIVNKRDVFDKFLTGLSNFDLRIAWIGWIMQFIVWSIRSLTDTLLRGVILAERTLSREMEFQADLVSVSVTGSESLINALHKLNGADDALERAMNFADAEYRNKTPVVDVFAVQTRVLEHLQSMYNDPHYGAAPPPPKEAPELHRVFKTAIAAPPRMWATHPASADREENAKIIFVRCAKDDRSAWELFPDAAGIRARMTGFVFAPQARDALEAPPLPVPLQESFARLDANYASKTIEKRYRGAYFGRSIARGFKNVEDMYNDAPAGNVAARIGALYPDTFGDALVKLRELFEEKNTFEGLKLGYLKAPGGVVRWRGEEVAPRELPTILKSLDDEISPLRNGVADHEREIRSAHLAAAKTVGHGWDTYLVGLASLIHYAEHTHADLVDVHGVLRNVFAVVTADRKVNKKEMRRLVAAANDVQAALAPIYAQAGDVLLDERTARRVDITTSFKEAMGEFKLPPAAAENIGDWLGAVDSWVHGTANALMLIRNGALQELLIAEDEVAAMLSSHATAAAPAAAKVPEHYPRMMIGDARPRQDKLSWWDRFQIADGLIAATVRFVIAASVVGAVIFAGAALAFGPTESAEPVTYDSTLDEPALATPADAPVYSPAEPATGAGELAPTEPIETPSADPEEPALAPEVPSSASTDNSAPAGEGLAPAAGEAPPPSDSETSDTTSPNPEAGPSDGANLPGKVE